MLIGYGDNVSSTTEQPLLMPDNVTQKQAAIHVAIQTLRCMLSSHDNLSKGINSAKNNNFTMTLLQIPPKE